MPWFEDMKNSETLQSMAHDRDCAANDLDVSGRMWIDEPPFWGQAPTSERRLALGVSLLPQRTISAAMDGEY